MAIDKMIVMNAQAEPELPKAMPTSTTRPWAASVPESTFMDGYNPVSSITDSVVPAYLKSLVNGADTEKAYAGFLGSRCGE